MLARIVDGRTDLVFDYLEHHEANATDKHGVSLIEWCAYYGDVSAIRYLIARGAELGDLGANLDLNGAVFHGHWRLCQFLLEHGADANFPQGDTGEVPLHVALCKANRPANDYIVRLLLKHGARTECQTKENIETACFMRDCRTKGETPLHRAAAFGSRESVQMLLDAGANCEVQDVNGETPLAWASWRNRPASILELLCYGAFSIHPLAVERSLAEEGQSWGGMERDLLGQCH